MTTITAPILSTTSVPTMEIPENISTSPLQSLSIPFPSPPSEEEAKNYYEGLPSHPTLVARTTLNPWVPGSTKTLGGFSNPELNNALRGTFARELISLFRSMNVDYTSVDFVRMVDPDVEYDWYIGAPRILWLGVTPGSLSADDGVKVAFNTKKLLVEHGFTDLEVEIRESIVHSMVYEGEPAPRRRKKKLKGKGRRKG